MYLHASAYNIASKVKALQATVDFMCRYSLTEAEAETLEAYEGWYE